VPVTTSDFELIQTNLKRRGPEPLLVTIRMQGRGSMTWQGRVNPDLPRAEAKEIPLPLSSKGGGPLAVKPSSDPNQLVPQSQVFLINVDFEEADTAVCTGTMAQVKIHNDYRSTAWWCWRSISQAIDLYLL
jgi:putative peptide zinc metalloprotease protein